MTLTTAPNIGGWFRRHPKTAIVVTTAWACSTGYVLAEQAGVDCDLLSSLKGSLATQLWPITQYDDGYCDVKDIIDGEWIPGQEHESWEDILARYHYPPDYNDNCEDPRVSVARPSPGQRGFEVARPYLQPARNPGCTIRSHDEEAFVIRMLRSPAGMFLAGDSITEHHMEIIVNRLHGFSSAGLLNRNATDGSYEYLHINRDHPSVPQLLAQAGVPESRLDLPLVSFWRDVHLVNREEKARNFASAGDRYTPEIPHLPDWYPIMLNLLEQTKAFESDMLMPEPHVLVLNAGAHWNDHLGQRLTDEDFIEAYRKMVKTVEAKIEATPFAISAFWRTTPPGQIDCELLDEFSNMRADGLSPVDESRRSYNYHLFPEMDACMRSNSSIYRDKGAFDHLLARTGTRKPNPRFRLIDVTPMSTKRPEAHLGPPGDCLHWCRPGPQEYWQNLLWHMIVEESLYHDYQIL